MNTDAQEIPWLIRKWWLFPLFPFVFFSLVMSLLLPFEYGISKRGQTIEATVTRQADYKKQMMICEYEVNGTVFTTSVLTPNAVDFSPDLVGRKVLVTFDPFHPANAKEGDARGGFGVSVIFCLLFLVFICFMFGLLGRGMKQNYLVKIHRRDQAIARGEFSPF
jgi:hypothetical protein